MKLTIEIGASRDGNYFGSNVIGDQGRILSAAILKRLYLKIIAYAADVLREDWSCCYVPNCQNILSAGSNEEFDKFVAFVLFAAQTATRLRAEIEGILALCTASQRDRYRHCISQVIAFHCMSYLHLSMGMNLVCAAEKQVIKNCAESWPRMPASSGSTTPIYT